MEANFWLEFSRISQINSDVYLKTLVNPAVESLLVYTSNI